MYGRRLCKKSTDELGEGVSRGGASGAGRVRVPIEGNGSLRRAIACGGDYLDYWKSDPFGNRKYA